ncbi:MAG TPA: hypothetical protein VLT45_00010 [Kofleriaceae bacterium]|nr:hypothetical protein [Kofleriaceae bacterium]
MKTLAAALFALTATRAYGDPIRLRADALATTQAPAGLLVLDGDATPSSLTSAEALVWTAGDALPGQQHVGDVLVMMLKARTADNSAAVRVGRFVATLGALRPVQVDGAGGRIRLPHRFDAEAYAGIPVLAGLTTARTWDWVAGGRLSRRLGDYGSAGLAFLEQRDDGRLATEEIGGDAGLALTKHDDVGARAAYDLANPGLAEVSLTATHRGDSLREDLYGTYRAASHLLPATSLFTVLGDTPSERAGAVLTWKAAPRLDVIGDAGMRYVDSMVAPAVTLRARLRLDDKGTSALSAEIRRDGPRDDAWTGARAAARISLPHMLTASTELEVVVPDDPRGRGNVWPWALAALGWDSGVWHAAAAIEASASPEDRRRLDALLNLGRVWGGK